MKLAIKVWALINQPFPIFLCIFFSTITIYPYFQDREANLHALYQERREYYLMAVRASMTLREGATLAKINCLQNEEYPSSIPYFKYQFMKDRLLPIEKYISGVDPSVNFYGPEVTKQMVGTIQWYMKNSKDCSGKAFDSKILQEKVMDYLDNVSRVKQFSSFTIKPSVKIN